MNDQKQKIPKLRPFPFAVMLSAVTVCCAYPAAFGSEILTLLTLILGAVSVLLFARSVPSVLLSGGICLLLWLYTSDISFAALFCSAVVALGFGAFVMQTLKRTWVFLSVLPVSYCIALMCGSSPYKCLLCLAYAPAMLLTAYSFRKNHSRVRTICASSIALGTSCIVAIAVHLIYANGYINVELLQSTADGLFDRMLESYTAQHAELALRYEEMGFTAAELGLTPSDARSYTVSVFGIIPALFILALNMSAFTANKLTLTLFERSGTFKALHPQSIIFSMSFVSAVIYIIVYVAMTVSSYTGNDSLSLALQNIYLILLPGLVVTGINSLIGRLLMKKIRPIWIVGIVLIAFASLNLALAVMAFVGSVFIIRITMIKALSRPGNV